MDDWDIIGHEWAVRQLQRAITANQLAQSHLFVGPAGVGKATLARAVARAVLGRDERARGLVAQGKHPDLIWIDPDGDSIKVDQIRDLLHTLTLAPIESQHRVAVVNGVDKLSDRNSAILKTLEEPNPSVMIILIAPNVESVLPTIASRCQVLNLRPVPVARIAIALVARGLAADRAASIARLSRGRPGWALRASDDGAVLEIRSARLHDLIGLLAANRTARFAYAEKLARADGDDLDATLDEWLLFWRDVTRLAGGGRADQDHVLNVDYRDQIMRLAESVGALSSAKVVRTIAETQRSIDRNVNARLALDVLFLKMPRIAAPSP